MFCIKAGLSSHLVWCVVRNCTRFGAEHKGHPRHDYAPRRTVGESGRRKTCSIHFTRKAVLDDHPDPRFGNVEITPSQSAKVCSATLDTRLAMDEHVSRVMTKGFRACLVLQTIKGVRPKQMRQLFQGMTMFATVVRWTEPSNQLARFSGDFRHDPNLMHALLSVRQVIA